MVIMPEESIRLIINDANMLFITGRVFTDRDREVHETLHKYYKYSLTVIMFDLLESERDYS